MSRLEKLRVWICIPPDNECITYELPLRNVCPSPVDWMGFKRRCCCCINLRAAAVFICIMSFIWAAYELGTVEKLIVKIFAKETALFNHIKVVYTLCVIVFLFSTALLMLGIIMEKYRLVHVYVWLAFLFNCIFLCACTVAALVHVFSAQSSKKGTFSLVFAVFWYCLFLYFVIIVNSYKMTLWT